MRVILDRVAAGAGARGPVWFKDTVGKDRALPDPDRAVSETRAAGADGIAVPAVRLPQIGVQPQWAVAVSLLGIALVAERPVAHLRVEGGEGQVAEGMAEALPSLRPVGPELGLPRVRQAFALRHDVIDRIRRERHALLSFVVLEPLEQGIAVSEAVHVAAHELGAEGLVRGEGNPVREAQEVRPDALDITLRIDGPRSRCEDRRWRGGPVAADRAAHHVGGDQPGQGEKVMPGETLSGIVAVEVEEEGPDRLHVEAGELSEGQCELRIGFLAEHHGAGNDRRNCVSRR